MKTAKILLCISIIINTQVYSKDYTLDSKLNILDQIQVSSTDKWALNGGIFQNNSNNLFLHTNGVHTLLVLSDSGELTTHQITIENGNDNPFNTNNKVLIDNKAPMIKYNWDNVISQGGQVIVGPKSRLNWKIEEIGSSAQLFINDEFTSSPNNSINITEDISKIVIQSSDEFQNKAETKIPFVKQFIGPEINWNLKPPSFKENNQWYANKTANLALNFQNSVSYWLNNNRITQDNSDLIISNNSEIKAEDSLGNITIEKIQWLEDSKSPEITVTTYDKTYTNPDKIKIKVGEKFHIQTRDNSVGLLNSEFGNNRDWFPLPKTFVFVDTGLYRLYIKSSDRIGNSITTYIVFKITK